MSLFSCDTNRTFDIHAGTFDVQNCNIHVTTSTDQSSIMVECRFAVNSTALSGIVVIKDEHNQPINERELNIKHGNNMKSVNITDLPTGNYKASVYDDIEDKQPAYQHPEFLKIVAHSPTPTPSTTVVHTGTTCCCIATNAVYVIMNSLLETAIAESSLVHGTVYTIVLLLVLP